MTAAVPDLLFGDERLENLRRLLDAGCHGRLESIVPPITVPGWMCMATSQDPGRLGVYGFRNRIDRSYEGMGIVNAKSVGALTLWDQLALEGRRSILIGVPPSYPPRKVNGLSVGCFLTPDPANDTYTHPASLRREIDALVGTYPVDVKGFRTHNKAWLRDEIWSMTRAHFKVVRHFLDNHDWDYFQFVEIGLDRVQHGFWKYHDPFHVLHQPDSPYGETIRDYYRLLDEELGTILERLTEDTIVLVVSDHGARRLDGGFCVNEWLVREGLLVLNSYPREVTPFSRLDVNWGRTKVWSEGGYYARIFLNVKGREPLGTIASEDYEAFRDEVKTRLEATTDGEGKPLGTVVFKPEEIYRDVRNVAPDLIVHFGGLAWRSIGGVGYPALHVLENDTGPDDCNHAQHGAFVLASSNNPLRGPIEGAHLLDIAPTLLELAGHDIPATMQGHSLVAGGVVASATEGYSPDQEELVRARLCGLGYLS